MRLGISKSKVNALDADTRELMKYLVSESATNYIFDVSQEVYQKYAAFFSTTPNQGSAGPALKRHHDRLRARMLPSDDRKNRWAAVADSWRKADSFIRSMASGITGNRADPAIKSLRVLNCHGIDDKGQQVQPPCAERAFNEKNGSHYCDACGCGRRAIAQISSAGGTADTPRIEPSEYLKLDFPHLDCPLKKPGFSNHE